MVIKYVLRGYMLRLSCYVLYGYAVRSMWYAVRDTKYAFRGYPHTTPPRSLCLKVCFRFGNGFAFGIENKKWLVVSFLE